MHNTVLVPKVATISQCLRHMYTYIGNALKLHFIILQNPQQLFSSNMLQTNTILCNETNMKFWPGLFAEIQHFNKVLQIDTIDQWRHTRSTRRCDEMH